MPLSTLHVGKKHKTLKLVGGHPEPYCSSARHLVRKMVIHRSSRFAQPSKTNGFSRAQKFHGAIYRHLLADAGKEGANGTDLKWGGSTYKTPPDVTPGRNEQLNTGLRNGKPMVISGWYFFSGGTLARPKAWKLEPLKSIDIHDFLWKNPGNSKKKTFATFVRDNWITC